MAEPLTYRPYRPADFPAVARLWADEAGWGDLTPEIWRQWFEDTPHGPCPVFVATTAAGEVVGQLVFTPAEVRSGDRILKGLRLSAPIIRAEYRTAAIRSVSHPAIMLWLTGTITCAARGFQLVYALPDRAWLPFFRAVGRFQVAEFPCLAAALHKPPVPPAGLLARQVHGLGDEHAAVWAEARNRFPIRCGVERTAGWLRYRNGGHRAVEVRDGATGSLVGYVAVHPKHGLLMDAIAVEPDALPGVLAAAAQALANPAAGEPPAGIDAIKAMAGPGITPALVAAGFVAVDFQFGLVVDVLDPDLDPTSVAPELWYSMPAD